MSLATCPIHGAYVADTSTDFGETHCPECSAPTLSEEACEHNPGCEHHNQGTLSEEGECVCAETSSRNCPVHGQGETEPDALRDPLETEDGRTGKEES